MQVDLVVLISICAALVGIAGAISGLNARGDNKLRRDVSDVVSIKDDITYIKVAVDDTKKQIKELSEFQKHDHDKLILVEKSVQDAHQKLNGLPNTCPNHYVVKQVSNELKTLSERG